MITALLAARVYDEYTTAKLEILTGRIEGPSEISKKERIVIQEIFSDYVDQVRKEGSIRFPSLGGAERVGAPATVKCDVSEFLGFGNTGPVYAVSVKGQPYALKIYSARQIREVMKSHGMFGLGGILQDMEESRGPGILSDLGKRVLARKPMGVYGRCKRMVRVHDVGLDANCMYVLMDLLAVDPIGKVDPRQMGGDNVDFVSWAVDCCVGLCNLHVEERRLHLNIRPEAFIKKAVTDKTRLPKYCFFHYPKKFYRPEAGPCLTTEFVMVDHLDTSVAISDKGPKGLMTIVSWPFAPPETVLQLLQVLRVHYDIYVEKARPVDNTLTIKLTRSQMDDIWALGLTLYQFLSGGKYPFGEPRSLVDMVNQILLTKFDFSPIEPPFRDLLVSMLEKDPKKRFSRILEGCPDKIRSRKVLAEALLYKLEEIGLAYES